MRLSGSEIAGPVTPGTKSKMTTVASWTAGFVVILTVVAGMTFTINPPQAGVAPAPPPPPPPIDILAEEGDILAEEGDILAEEGDILAEEGEEKAPRAPADDVVDAVRSLVARMENQTLPEIWRSVDRLVSIGKNAVPVLREQMARTGDRPRLGCARALLRLGDLETREEALGVLVELVRETKDRETKIACIRSLTEHGEPEEVLEFLSGSFQETIDPFVTIALAKALWELDNVPEARAKMIEFLSSRDPSIHKTAALA